MIWWNVVSVYPNITYCSCLEGLNSLHNAPPPQSGRGNKPNQTTFSRETCRDLSLGGTEQQYVLCVQTMKMSHPLIFFLTAASSVRSGKRQHLCTLHVPFFSPPVCLAPRPHYKASFPGNLHLVLVLRPTSFFHRTVTDIGFRFSQEDFMLKMPVRQPPPSVSQT